VRTRPQCAEASLGFLASAWRAHYKSGALRAALSQLATRFVELTLLSSHLFHEIRINGLLDRKSREPWNVIEGYRRVALVSIVLGRELGLTPLARQQFSNQTREDDLAALLARSATRNGSAPDEAARDLASDANDESGAPDNPPTQGPGVWWYASTVLRSECYCR
jgi:hypothetical protein